MKRGFQYDTSLCVGCNACNAACILENGLQPGTRTVYTWNRTASLPFAVVNLSLACNHCSRPACLEGCPAKAYTIDSAGNVIHHQERCMGCKYCTWCCPYDAPKINQLKGYIEKCHFCYERATEGVDPACVTGCPTGAIKTVFEENFSHSELDWFPDKGLFPSVNIITGKDHKKPVVFPYDEIMHGPPTEKKTSSARQEWSLILFSLLITASAVTLISSYLRDTVPGYGTALIMLSAAMAISFWHLGVRKKAWRSAHNISKSPLSREIAGILLLFVTCLAGYADTEWLPPILPPAAALLSLILVDLVYIKADSSNNILLHSGQTFFSGILAASFLSGSINAFLLFTVLASGSVVLRYNTASRGSFVGNLYYYRAFTLPAALILMWFGSIGFLTAAGAIMITGIISDRILFFEDFRPENIRGKITDNHYEEYEKERDKQRQDTDLP